MRWHETHKGDARCRELADRHYTRQHVGHPMWTRPGYNQVLFTEDEQGSAVFVWWRPKWEAGLPGTARKDGLRCIECTIFRNETKMLSSGLIVEAMQALLTWPRATDVEWPDGIITAVSSERPAHRRSSGSLPGHCFRQAGFVEFAHPGANKRADVWLRYAGDPPEPVAPHRIALPERCRGHRCDLPAHTKLGGYCPICYQIVQGEHEFYRPDFKRRTHPLHGKQQRIW
jgi:hypothetical protein